MPDFKLSFFKLVDEAILPAFLLVGVKAISFMYLVVSYGLPVKFPDDLLNLILLRSDDFYAQTLILVNSVSNLFVLLVIVVYFGWVVIKAHHFHTSHVSPKFHQKLLKSGWEHLLEESYEIYHQGLVWFAFSWLVFFHLAIEAYLGLAFYWVPLIGLAVVFSMTMMMMEDVINELKIRNPKSENRNKLQ